MERIRAVFNRNAAARIRLTRRCGRPVGRIRNHRALTTVGTGKEPDARSDVELVALGKQGVENQAQFGEKLLLVQPAVQGEEFPGGVQYCTVEAASQDSMPQMMTASTSSSWRSMAL